MYSIRDADSADIETLVNFTLQEARESEGVEKDRETVTRGVGAAFAHPPRATYWVAERDGHVVASISAVTEWSNFHGGDYWWVQSLFVAPEHRGSGLVDLLLNHVAKAAQSAGALDLRLYAHNLNERALGAYRRAGFVTAPYVIMRRELPQPS